MYGLPTLSNLIWKLFLSLDAWLNCDFNVFPCKRFPPATHMIIRCCVAICLMGPCFQMQINCKINTHLVRSQLMSLSYIFPRSGIKLSCLTDTESCEAISIIHLYKGPSYCPFSLCPYNLMANRPRRGGRPHAYLSVFLANSEIKV